MNDALRNARLPESLRLGACGSAVDATTALRDLDLQLALACCYELNYRGFDDVDDESEWDAGQLALRAALERYFLTALRARVPWPTEALLSLPVHEGLSVVVNDAGGQKPSASTFLMRDANLEHWRDFMAQRSVYQLKEADPHTWQIPRVHSATKAALVEIQTDEYGGGNLARMHSALFAQSMREIGLDETYGRYWDEAIAETHATVNLMSLFGLHRRWRGASLGHLAALEMTSTVPNRRYGNGLRRLGFGPRATAYFDEHVEADAVHEQVAAVDLCGALVRAEPMLHADVLWGAACCLALDEDAGATMLRRWAPAPAVAS
jgi:hypothetical protein